MENSLTCFSGVPVPVCPIDGPPEVHGDLFGIAGLQGIFRGPARETPLVLCWRNLEFTRVVPALQVLAGTQFGGAMLNAATLDLTLGEWEPETGFLIPVVTLALGAGTGEVGRLQGVLQQIRLLTRQGGVE